MGWKIKKELKKRIRQWNNWSFPSKASVAGTVIGVLSLIIALMQFTSPSPGIDSSEEFFIKPFVPKAFGILIAPFTAHSQNLKNRGLDIRSTIAETLDNRLKEYDIKDVIIKEVASSSDSNFKSHQEARQFGARYNADLVIWGKALAHAYVPKITIVEPSSPSSQISENDLTISDNSNTYQSIGELKDINFCSMTDIPLSITLFSIGVHYFKKSCYKPALELFQKFHELSSDCGINSALVHFYAGLCCSFSRKYDEAILQFTKVIEYESDLKLYSYNNRALAYNFLKQYDLAIRDLTVIIDCDHDNAIAYGNRGTVYYNKKDYEKAIVDYKIAIELKEDYATGYNNLGNAYSDLGYYFEALKNYNKAIQINKHYANPYFNKGNAYAKNNYNSEAIEEYTKAIEIDPTFFKAYCNRGATYIQIDEYELGIKDLNWAIQIKKDYVEAYYNLILAYWISRDKKRALVELKNTANMHQRIVSLGLMLAAMDIVSNNDYETALEFLNSLTSHVHGFDLVTGYLFLQCICRRMLDMDTSDFDRRFEKIMNVDFKIEWSFDGIRDWLEKSEMTQTKKAYIQSLNEKLKAHT
jgi:tetratricopeptide (TPR) repeat protein